MESKIEELVQCWLDWIKNNSIALNSSANYKERYLAALDCERLINKRYKLIEEIDELFEAKAREKNKTTL